MEMFENGMQNIFRRPKQMKWEFMTWHSSNFSHWHRPCYLFDCLNFKFQIPFNPINSMIKSIKLLTVLAAFSVASAVLLQAGPVGTTGSFKYKRYDAYSNGSGGEFTLFDVTNLDLSGYVAGVTSGIEGKSSSFQTFCLERTENAANSHFVVGTEVVRGSTGSSDALSLGTSWLYSQFAQGSLSSYLYNDFSGNSRDDSAELLQLAIWALEGEDVGSTNLTTNVFYQAAISNFGSLAAATSDATVGAYGVYVLNNFDSASNLSKFVNSGDDSKGRKQDFVYFAVPEGGATAMLLGLAFGAAALVRRATRRA